MTDTIKFETGRLAAAGTGRGFAMVLFVGRWPLALACAVACFQRPEVGLMGLAGALAVSLLALAFGLNRSSVALGLVGLNGLLVGLAVGAWFGLSPVSIALWAAGCLAVVVVWAALSYFLGGLYNLPVLSLPFVLVAALIYAAGTGPLGLTLASLPTPVLDINPAWLPAFIREYLLALAALFFQNSLLAGLLVLVGLLVTSRMMVLLTVIGFAVGQGLTWALGIIPSALSPQSWGFNLLLTAVAVGGVFFIPSPRAFVAAAVAAVLGGLVSLALVSAFESNPGLILAWPFNLTVLGLLLAARARLTRAGPAAVDFVPDTPERNLEYHTTRRRRYRGFAVPVFRLPLKGRWRVQQGPGDGPTHRQEWAQAWDFVGAAYDGRPFRGEGGRVEHHLIYGQEVLAAAGGRVVRVVDGVPDNPVGHENLAQRWGNLVALWHAGDVYTLYAHLIPGSIAVTEGQSVIQGQVLGRTGNSGRSGSPHLHFHAQRSPEIGAPTIEAELTHYLQVPPSGGRRYRFTGSPRQGDLIEDPLPSADLESAFRLSLGRRLEAKVTSGGRERTETWIVRSDLLSGSYLYDEQRRARLFFSGDGLSFFTIDYVGSRASGLFALYLTASRVPYTYDPELTWSDVLPTKVLDNPWLRAGLELILPFAEVAEVRAEKAFLPAEQKRPGEWTYGLRTELYLRRAGQNAESKGRLLLSGEAWFSPRRGPVWVKVEYPDGRKVEVELVR